MSADPVYGSTNSPFMTIILTVIAAAVIGSGSAQVVSLREIGIVHFQVDQLSKRADSFVTGNELDQRDKNRDLKEAEIHQEISDVAARVAWLENHKR